MGDMQSGTVNISGRLDASAPNGGNGGFIETSVAQVFGTGKAFITTLASSGQTGNWLIDPNDYNIGGSGGSGGSGGNISGSDLATKLNSTNVTIKTFTDGSTNGNGDIFVNETVTKISGAATTLRLEAERNITVKAPISGTSGSPLNITLSAANSATATTGGVTVLADLALQGGQILIGGAGGSVTAARTVKNGIGYALQASSATAGVTVGSGVSISSGGGDITINGYSTTCAGSALSLNLAMSGVYIIAGTSSALPTRINSGGGNIFISGIYKNSDTSDTSNVAGVAVEKNSQADGIEVATSSTTGHLDLDAWSTVKANSLSMQTHGDNDSLVFKIPSVADMRATINHGISVAEFTYTTPPAPGYSNRFPNRGTLLVPGSNSSYGQGTYYAQTMPTHPIYVNATGVKVYDGSTATAPAPATLTVTYINDTAAPTFKSAFDSSLSFSTASKNVGFYPALISSAVNSQSVTVLNGQLVKVTMPVAADYAIGYYGNYTITPKTVISLTANSKYYDGTTAATVSGNGIISGDQVLVLGGGFASANANATFGAGTVDATHLSSTAQTVSVTGFGGTDVGNYSMPDVSSLPTLKADIWRAPLTITPKSFTRAYIGNINALSLSPSDADADKLAATPVISSLRGLQGAMDTITGLSESYNSKNAGSIGKTLSVNSGYVIKNAQGADVGANYAVTIADPVAGVITQAVLSTSGATVAPRTYNATSVEAITGAALVCMVTGEAVTISGAGSFANANVGPNKPVTAALVLDGVDGATTR